VGNGPYNCLGRAAFIAFRALQRVHAEQLEEDEARLLAIPTGSSALYIAARNGLRRK
jgi:hypothetical protein